MVTTRPSVQAPASNGLDLFNQMERDRAATYLRRSCGVNVPTWGLRTVEQRPFGNVADLVASAEDEVERLTEEQIAASHHGLARLGAPKSGSDPETRWSSTESQGIDRNAEFLRDLDAAHDAYEARFGHVFLISATGLSGDEILRALRERTGNDRATETRVIKEELAKFLAIRIPKVLHELAEPGRSR
ncbi:2-oxo-4-hydroxy-4-carboxy-5-ureidoimidazoline decarboxylase [Streptomyces sp. NPDC046821]|uniref:2-oxo-4-hydroxy-4-carboxy-5-ureidoimidazoline decarboxylase n=1 Tax=Streptomyces sp. NPDC046821 TaxID=3154702 RepID=UPI0033D4C240